ncbi:hypothetical protein [Pontibacter anaerobius]|uniref:Uncharacterized protein n=1 Tax=Pontibacter anaerobius TaxID=2993940 RepID=A0ABT3RH82_9BACT|nr:hypothetical protein [Pontibacter anaerobius]MCX2740989.1 hypothetical protein [Pontibacter anaerobius]
MPKFDGSEGVVIELATASQWTKNYREHAKPDPARGMVVKGHFFGRQVLEQILSQEGCMGIRMYHAVDERGQRQMVLVGANADGEDMVEGTVVDGAKVCPPDCVQSALNG